jgi:hypothetical protein
MVVVEPSQEPLGCAMSAVVEDEEEEDDVDGGEEARAVDGRPPMAPERLRGGGVSKE